MNQFTIEQLQKIISGQVLHWDESKIVTCFGEYPEKPKKDCMYIVLDKDFDETALIERLLRYNALGAIISRNHSINIDSWKSAGLGIVIVESVKQAYYQLAEFYRTLFSIPFIQVIGSSGKTTTKDMIGSVLSQRLHTLVGFRNYNAPLGIAYNIMQLEETHEAAVLEAGMKAFGVMDFCTNMIKPDIGVVTCIHRAHLASMGSIENIAKAKGEMLDYMSENSTLIINGDDDNCKLLPLSKYRGKLLRYGLSPTYDLWATDITYKDSKTYFKVQNDEITMELYINLFGKYNVYNALAAISTALQFGLSEAEIRNGLASFYPSGGRQELIEGKSGIVILNDNFNANPDSTGLLLQELPTIAANRELILIIGDMERPDPNIEEYAKAVHYQIGQEAAATNFYLLIAVGKWASEYISGALAMGVHPERLIYCSSVAEARDIILERVKPNSLVVFKASKTYVDFTPIVDAIKKI